MMMTKMIDDDEHARRDDDVEAKRLLYYACRLHVKCDGLMTSASLLYIATIKTLPTKQREQ